MSNLTEKVAFIKGLAEGMKLSEDTAEHKLMLKIIDALEEFAHYAEETRTDLDDLSEFVEEINEDLSSMEEDFYEDEDEDGCSCDEHHHHGAEEEGDDADSSVVEYECPHCGYMTHFDVADFDLEEDYRCPSCHQPLFPETEEGEDDEDASEE